MFVILLGARARNDNYTGDDYRQRQDRQDDPPDQTQAHGCHWKRPKVCRQ
jgi:hypothetical protein